MAPQDGQEKRVERKGSFEPTSPGAPEPDPVATAEARTLDYYRLRTDGGEPESLLKDQDDLDGEHPWNPRLQRVDTPPSRSKGQTPEERSRVEAVNAAEDAIEEEAEPDLSDVRQLIKDAEGPSAVDLSKSEIEAELDPIGKQAAEPSGFPDQTVPRSAIAALRRTDPDDSKPIDGLGAGAEGQRNRSDQRLRAEWSQMLADSGMLEDTVATHQAGRFDTAAELVSGYFGVPVERAREVLAQTVAESKAERVEDVAQLADLYGLGDGEDVRAALANTVEQLAATFETTEENVLDALAGLAQDGTEGDLADADDLLGDADT